MTNELRHEQPHPAAKEQELAIEPEIILVGSASQRRRELAFSRFKQCITDLMEWCDGDPSLLNENDFRNAVREIQKELPPFDGLNGHAMPEAVADEESFLERSLIQAVGQYIERAENMAKIRKSVADLTDGKE